MDSSTAKNAEARPKIGRTGKPKTRTGCLTCKVRRIKCDESKPFCKRCTLTGRICDGYRQTSNAKGTDSQPFKNAKLQPATAPAKLHLIIKFHRRVPPQLMDYSDRTSSENRSLEYFRCCTANVLSQWMVENFWKYQLPQTAHSEPATRHAMIALAKMHEYAEIRREGLPNDPRLSAEVTARELEFARHHHNVAVSELARALRERTDSEEIALMVCALFVIFNYISGNFSTAVFHMHNGIEIMSRWKASKIGSRILREGSLEKNLITLFARLSNESTSLENSTSNPKISDATMISFPTLEAAKRSMDSLTREGLRLVRLGVVDANDPHAPDRRGDLDLQISTYRVDLSRWLTEFDNLVASQCLSCSKEDEAFVHILRLTHLICHIWMWEGLSPPEEPEPTSILVRFVELAEELYTKWANDSPSCQGGDIFDSGIVPPLVFIIKSSFNEPLKRRAEALLLQAARFISFDKSATPMRTQLTDASPTSMSLDTGVADVGERGVVEVEVEPGVTQIGISMKAKKSGDGWEVRKDFVV